ncbi:MAG: TonB-dependent receptor domain-containing protein [Pseudomarimonas sp.]
MTNRTNFRLSRLTLGLAIALATAPVFAQDVSSALNGRIQAGEDAPVAGALVTIVHTPSGTTSTTTTDDSGRYTSRGLRVGGPYTVTISKDGYRTESKENVFLTIGSGSNVSVDLLATTQLDAIEVTAASLSSTFSPSRMGAGTDISRQTLDELPSIQRNLQDYARLDPRISQTDKDRGEISAGGQNSRYNSITIDGVNTSDTFGLEANNLPTQKQPISIDAIDSVQINVSNYDVTQKGYTGANINAVTKSGTNEFHGAVYYIYRDEEGSGDRFNRVNNSFSDPAPFEEDTAGFVLGGPILKDRLFFFASYEDFRSTRSEPDFGPIGSAQNNVAVTQSEVAGFQQIASSQYQIDVGNFDFAGAELAVENSLIKLDANLGDNHRASLRWSETTESDPIFPNNFGGTNPVISLSSQGYSQDKTIETYVGQLFSDWSDIFSTEVKLSFRDYFSEPINNSNLPSIRLNFARPLPAGSPPVSNTSAGLIAGTERSRHFNQLGTETINLYLSGNLFLDEHDVKFGIDYDDNEVFNAFLQDTRGNYTFGCINSTATLTYTSTILPATVNCGTLTRAQNEAAVLENFRRGRPSNYLTQIAAPGFNLSDGAANWDYQNLGVFIQDTWSVNYNLTITAGLRIDRKTMDTAPLFNAAASAPVVAGALTNSTSPQTGTVTRATGGFGIRNDETLDGNSLFQPRLGFNYTFDSDRPTQLRGGFGLFEGAAANVWLSNPYSNTGLATRVIGCGTSGFPACSSADGLFSANPANQPTNFPGASPAANVDFLSSELEQPSVWKANLAFEHELPWNGIVVTAEYIHTETDNGLFYRHLNLGNPTRQGSDGRDQFWTPQGYNTACFRNDGSTINNAAPCIGFRNRALNNASFNNVTVAERTEGGSGDSLSFGINGRMFEDFSWGLGYAFTRATEVSQLSSSVGNSSWQSLSVFNANEEVDANSAYLVRDRFTGVLNWSHSFFGDYATSAGLFYEGRRGKPYSWIYNNDLNGDASTNDLLYIPTAPGSGEVVFRDLSTVANGSADEEAAFWNIVAQNGLSQYAGGVVPRNSAFAQWTNSFDLRISQEFPGFLEGNKISLVLDILNVGNLINKDWGRIDEVAFQSQGGLARSFVNYLGTDASGRYIYGVDGQVEDFVTRQVKGESQWAAQLTLKYEF